MRIQAFLLALFCLPATAQEQSGEAVFNATCIHCHGTGKDGAPVFGNHTQWGKLVREGLNELVPTALVGIRKMPARGGNPALSDSEVAHAVIYMANAGGGRFAAPSTADITRWRNKADKRHKK